VGTFGNDKAKEFRIPLGEDIINGKMFSFCSVKRTMGGMFSPGFTDWVPRSQFQSTRERH
jgi:hypothetical protein